MLSSQTAIPTTVRSGKGKPTAYREDDCGDTVIGWRGRSHHIKTHLHPGIIYFTNKSKARLAFQLL